MAYPLSPLFPDASLALSPGRSDEPSTLLPQLPQQPLISTSTLQVYIVPAEKHLFVQGFKPAEYETRPPTLLRGSLVLRVLKPNKIKAVSLSFKGVQNTDWPEGIPPKRHFFNETNDLVNHSWPFYQQDTHLPNFGADIVVPAGKNGTSEEVSHLSLDSTTAGTSSLHLQLPSQDPPSTSGGSFAASLMKMAHSTTHSLSPVNSFADLSAVLSTSHANDGKPGTFPPGDYVYNFEHPIPASSPETISANFGSVNYYLETTITRSTTFKSNLSARLPIDVVRIPSDNSVEENEPIVIERDWEDQLRYEIVVASKSVVLDTYLPISLRFIPLFGKVALHRIRIYITEDCNYYCNNKSVHRTEPSHKYLLLEHKAKKHQSLLSKNGGNLTTFDPSDEVLPRELEFQLFVPSTVNKKFDYSIHLDTAVENIQCNHWIKISLRISKQDPENPEKRKHFEISIDSPIHLFSPLAAHNNTLLPVYTSGPEYLPEYTHSPLTSPGVTAIDASNQQTSQSLLSVFGNNPGSDNAGAVPRPSTPIQFQHISSTLDNADPVQRDNDMHLDSNLYSPENEEMLTAIGSPQATAFSPIASPVGSPVRNPPEPSMEPPSFNIVGVTEDTLPPAYEQESSSMNLSPLRLDNTGDLHNDNSSSSIGIKDKLNKSFEPRGRKSFSEKGSLKSDGSSSQSIKSHRDSQDSGSNKSSTYLRSGTETGPVGLDVAPQNRGRSSISSADSAKNLAPSFSSRKGSIASQHSQNSENRSSVPEIEVPSTDITDLVAHSPNSVSRRSSISSSNYRTNLANDSDLDLTLPLLSLSTTRNEARLSIDSGRNYDPMGSMTDIVASHRFDELRVPTSLSNFRNPRLTKHYQEDTTAEDEKVLEAFGKPRQKSFGVLPHIHRPVSQSEDDTDESKTTLSEVSHSSKDTPYKIGNESQRMMSN